VTSPRPRTLRAAAFGAGLAVVGLALAGCSATNPMTTQDAYSASDGVVAVLGDVRGLNLLVLSEAEGDPGSLQGGLVNDGTSDRLVTLAVGDQATTVSVGPKETVLLGLGRGTDEGHAEVLFPAMEVPPGAMQPITISTPEAGSTVVEVPVLNGILPEYATDIPTPTPSS
jgi:hypothetical protein